MDSRSVNEPIDSQATTTGIKLKKNISICHGVSIVIGIIVGSGIFVSPVGVLQNTKSVGLSLIMWLVTAMFSTLGAIVYAELGVTIQRSGGEYIYILDTFGPMLAFVALWITFAVIGAASCAVNAMVFARYIVKPFFLTCDSPIEVEYMIALLGILILCFINCYRVKWSTNLTAVFTVFKVLALLLIIGVGVYKIAIGSTDNFTDLFENSETNPVKLAAGFYQGFWAFAGWNYLNFLTGEVKNPARSMPIIIGISMSIITVIYLLVNVAYLTVLTPHELLNINGVASAVAVTFAQRSIGPAYWLMPIFVGASVYGSINSEVLAMSRLAFTGAENGHMPTLLAMISIENYTPVTAVLSIVILSIFFGMHPEVDKLIELTGLAFSVNSTIAVISLIYIRIKRPHLNTTNYRLPLPLPIVFLILNFGIGVLTVVNSPTDSLTGLGIMCLGIPVYLVGVSWKNKPAAFQFFMHKVTITMQKLFLLVPSEDFINATARRTDASGEAKAQPSKYYDSLSIP